MRILIVTRSYNKKLGGMERHSQLVVDYLTSKGHEITIAAPAGEFILKKNTPNNYIELGNSPNEYTKYSFSFWRNVKRLVQNGSDKFDIIINISMSIGLPLPWKTPNQKIITILHGTYVSERATLIRSLKKDIFNLKSLLGIPYTYIFDYILRLVCSRSARVVCISSDIKEQLVNLYGQKADKITVIHNFVQSELLKPAANIPTKPTKFIYVSRIHKEKGILFLAEMLSKNASKIIKINPAFHLEIVGDGPDMQELKRYVSHNKHIQNLISFKGRLAADGVAKSLAENHVSIFPTLRDEGMPLAMLESLSCGLPVIASNVKGIREVVTSGVNGKLFKAGDQNQLCKAICDFLTKDDYLSYSNDARALIIKKYTIDAQLHKLTTLIKSQMNSHIV